MAIDLMLTGMAVFMLVFLSTIESAYESLSDISLRVMLAEREATSRRRFFREMLDHRLRFELMLIFGTQLSTVLIAILLFNISLRLAVPYPLAITFVVAFIIVMLFRQLLPRMLAQNQPEDVLWRLLPFFRLFYQFAYIFIAPVSSLLSKARKEDSLPARDEEETEETKEEIQAFIDVGEEQGIIEESEGEMIQSIVEFSDTRAEQVMRARSQIVAIESSATIGDARRLIMESKYSRIPVYRQQLDHVEGILHVRDLLAFCDPEKLSIPVTACMRPAYFVPESKQLAELLEEMQKAKIQLAIVIDEYGGVAGLVTVEDIVEEIVGEIEDEDRAPAAAEMVKEEDGSYLVNGSAEIRKVEMLFEKELEADDFTTVAGLIISELGHVPAVGEKLQFKGLEFEVADADNRRVNRVRLRPIEATGDNDGHDGANHGA
jgi:putative hemolysin